MDKKADYIIKIDTGFTCNLNLVAILAVVGIAAWKFLDVVDNDLKYRKYRYDYKEYKDNEKSKSYASYISDDGEETDDSEQ